MAGVSVLWRGQRVLEPLVAWVGEAQGLWRCGSVAVLVLRTPYWYYVLGTTAHHPILYPIGVVLYPISGAQEVHAVRASLGLRYAGCRSCRFVTVSVTPGLKRHLRFGIRKTVFFWVKESSQPQENIYERHVHARDDDYRFGSLRHPAGHRSALSPGEAGCGVLGGGRQDRGGDREDADGGEAARGTDSVTGGKLAPYAPYPRRVRRRQGGVSRESVDPLSGVHVSLVSFRSCLHGNKGNGAGMLDSDCGPYGVIRMGLTFHVVDKRYDDCPLGGYRRISEHLSSTAAWRRARRLWLDEQKKKGTENGEEKHQ